MDGSQDWRLTILRAATDDTEKINEVRKCNQSKCFQTIIVLYDVNLNWLTGSRLGFTEVWCEVGNIIVSKSEFYENI